MTRVERAQATAREEAVGVVAWRDVRAVTPYGLVDGAVVVSEAGRIVEVGRGPAPAGALDGRGLLCLPGLVDAHTDGLEKEVAPRPTARFPEDFALLSFEGRVRAAGITTVFHGVSFEERSEYNRSIALANRLCDVIHERGRAGTEVGVDHRILHRLEARSPVGLDALLDRVDESRAASPAPVVSFEDHSPGQGQFRDLDKFRAAIDTAKLPAGMSADEFVDRQFAAAESRLVYRERSRVRLGELARAGEIRLLAHDLEDAAQVAESHGWGASVVEFPLTRDAAEEARRRELPVVLGAPNALRGGSHSGNVAARELVAAGLCTALASDYLPATMLAAAFRLADGACDLPAAVRLVTAGPARAIGLADRGRLEPGSRADIVLVDDRGSWPEVRGVWRAGDPR